MSPWSVPRQECLCSASLRPASKVIRIAGSIIRAAFRTVGIFTISGARDEQTAVACQQWCWFWAGRSEHVDSGFSRVFTPSLTRVIPAGARLTLPPNHARMKCSEPGTVHKLPSQTRFNPVYYDMSWLIYYLKSYVFILYFKISRYLPQMCNIKNRRDGKFLRVLFFQCRNYIL